MENQDIDKMFNDAGKSAEENPTFPAFEKVWEKVEEKLDKKEKKKRIIPIWLPYGMVAGLALTFGVLYFMKDDKVKIEPQIADRMEGKPFNPNKVKVPANVEEINKTFEENLGKNPINTSGNARDIIAYQEAPMLNVVSPPIIYHNASPVADAITPQANYKVSNEIQFNLESGQEQENTKTKDIEGVVVTAMGINTEAKSLGYATTTVNKKVFSQDNKSYIPPAPSISAGKVATQTYVDQVLNGRVAGLNFSKALGAPGGSPAITIRGVASLNQNNQPLYVIDGIPYEKASLENIDANKIKDVQVLKDASATALYGTRGSNGVVVIQTKGLSKKEIDLLNNPKPTQNQESYDEWKENKFELAKAEPLSTFSIDVDKASYSNIRRMINNGESVDKNAVRIEEMINYFNYNYPQPKNNQPFSINTEYNDSPWNPKHKLLKIGLQGKILDDKELPASNLVFLIDVSGSMNEQNKLPLLKTSFKILLEKLRPQDKVALVTYAGNAGVVLEPTSAKNKEKILSALENLSAGGSTAGGQGIELAYKLAQENLVKNGNNRVILATDGDFNVGVSNNSELQKLIEQKRQSGIFLTCLGFGMGNYKDNRLEMLADKGNGNYAYIDNMQESNKFLGKEFAGSMYAIAKDVKIQIEFNPKFVKSYRLIGYENRKLRNEDFKNDKIDAGELGIGHTVTAIYEIIPNGSDSEFSPQDIDLKYSKNEAQNEFGDELATVKFRYKNPDEDVSKELIQTIKDSKNKLSNASSDFKFASSVAWFGLVLRQSEFIKDKDLNKIINLAKQGKSNDEDGYRSEFIRLIESYKQIK
jgi:Ca-activated chloride channel family protein